LTRNSGTAFFLWWWAVVVVVVEEDDDVVPQLPSHLMEEERDERLGPEALTSGGKLRWVMGTALGWLVVRESSVAGAILVVVGGKRRKN